MREKKHHDRHHHRPPWWEHDHGAEDREGEEGATPWWREHDHSWKKRPPAFGHRPPEPHADWSPSDRRLFFRFALAFGLFALLGCVILAVLAAALLLLIQQRSLPLPTPQLSEHPLRGIAILAGLGLFLLLALRHVGRLTTRRWPSSRTA